MKAVELQRRQNNTEKVLALFRAKPREWIDASEFMRLAGSLAWRTRISDARKILEAEGGTIENHQRRVIMTDEHNDGDGYTEAFIVSEYRYLPQRPLGPEASTDRPQLGLW